MMSEFNFYPFADGVVSVADTQCWENDNNIHWNLKSCLFYFYNNSGLYEPILK